MKVFFSLIGTLSFIFWSQIKCKCGKFLEVIDHAHNRGLLYELFTTSEKDFSTDLDNYRGKDSMQHWITTQRKVSYLFLIETFF